ncbi:hypothetical protein L873DRAFT_1840592 [Choiromyces venosus 120613-1]|uniref:Protein YAE1 n=1 Tax=Choiromyces venosus 120613-1 TaxID=1336337 RepID=A0A3N4K3K1_9PEZI|nr:hypothetical protein L873DRAFT_1840592 [Choiromyces venosus 120613-1]
MKKKMLLSSLLSSRPSTPPPPQRTPSPSENPDLTRLHHTHHTHGYLAGITAGKALHVQSGFDEGYALGARFGLKIGWVLGVLQGLLHLHTGPSRGGGGGGGRVVKGELEKAKVELSFGQVFTREYFVCSFECGAGGGGGGYVG